MVPDALLGVNFRRIMRTHMPDLIACPSCNRNNGVRRTTCIYCGFELPVTEDTVDLQVPTFKPVEEWESGVTVVLAPFEGLEPTPHQVARLRDIARLEDDVAAAFFGARCSLPVARVSSQNEAELVRQLLSAAGLQSTLVADDPLALDVPPKRVREIRLTPSALEMSVIWSDWTSLPRESVALVVEGRVVSTTVELVEGARSRRKTEVANSSHTFSESRIVDIYGATVSECFRIRGDSFDFSCLGERPSFRLDDNIVALRSLLMQYLGENRYDTTFSSVAKLLEHAWPQRSLVRSFGLSPRGDFKKYTRSAVTTDALAQFSRYSRTLFALARASVVDP